MIETVHFLNEFLNNYVRFEYKLGTALFDRQQSDEFEFYVANRLNSPKDYENILFKNTTSITIWRSTHINKEYSLNPKYIHKKFYDKEILIYPKRPDIWRLLKRFFKEATIHESDIEDIFPVNLKFRDIKINVDTHLSKPGFSNVKLKKI